MASDWRDRIEQILIAGGTDGVKQSKIVMGLANLAEAEVVLEHLESLLQEDKVQKFNVKTKGRPLTVWRATVKILPKNMNGG